MPFVSKGGGGIPPGLIDKLEDAVTFTGCGDICTWNYAKWTGGSTVQ